MNAHIPALQMRSTLDDLEDKKPIALYMPNWCDKRNSKHKPSPEINHI